MVKEFPGTARCCGGLYVRETRTQPSWESEEQWEEIADAIYEITHKPTKA